MWSFYLQTFSKFFLKTLFFHEERTFVIYLLSSLTNSFVQAMIIKYETISSKKLPLMLQILTRDKTIVAFSNYDDQYHMLKKVIVGRLFNINTQVTTILYLSFINQVLYLWLLQNFVVCVSLAFFVYLWLTCMRFFMNSCNGW